MAQIIIRRTGTCLYCGNEFDVRGMARHLSACTARKRVVDETARRRVSNSDLYHLRVQDEWSKDFWIDVEMKGTESLGSLDHYLRAIWLECCGHLSMFSRNGWNSHEFPPETRIREVFRPGIQISYIYDFGSSSEILIRNVSIRTGKTNRTPLPGHSDGAQRPACLRMYNMRRVGDLAVLRVHHRTRNMGNAVRATFSDTSPQKLR